MGNYNTQRNLFVSKCESKSPIKLSCLRPTATGLIFYNSNIGSRITDVPGVTFKYENTEKVSMKNIEDIIAPKTIIDFTGNIKWIGELRSVLCGKGDKKER